MRAPTMMVAWSLQGTSAVLFVATSVVVAILLAGDGATTSVRVRGGLAEVRSVSAVGAMAVLVAHTRVIQTSVTRLDDTPATVQDVVTWVARVPAGLAVLAALTPRTPSVERRRPILGAAMTLGVVARSRPSPAILPCITPIEACRVERTPMDASLEGGLTALGGVGEADGAVVAIAVVATREGAPLAIPAGVGDRASGRSVGSAALLGTSGGLPTTTPSAEATSGLLGVPGDEIPGILSSRILRQEVHVIARSSEIRIVVPMLHSEKNGSVFISYVLYSASEFFPGI